MRYTYSMRKYWARFEGHDRYFLETDARLLATTFVQVRSKCAGKSINYSSFVALCRVLARRHVAWSSFPVVLHFVVEAPHLCLKEEEGRDNMDSHDRLSRALEFHLQHRVFSPPTAVFCGFIVEKLRRNCSGFRC